MDAVILDSTGLPIATLRHDDDAGEVRYFFSYTADGDAVNVQHGRISRAKKWANWEAKTGGLLPAAQLVDNAGLYRRYRVGL